MKVKRESIFKTAIRAFARMFFGVFGLLFALLVMVFVLAFLGSAGPLEMETKIKYLPDAANKKAVVSFTAPVILQIDISGVIGEPRAGVTTESIENILIESRMEILKTDRVKGILLYMNTPGGTVVDSDNIYRMLKVYKEQYHVPVYAYIDGLCASGGMYISCAADKVFAGPASLVGSVGVLLGPFFNVIGAMEKVGVKSETITAGLDKDMMSPFRPWKEHEDESLRSVTDHFYHQFVDLVVSSHPRMDRSLLVQEYGARVFDAVGAQERGYIDVANSSRNEALVALLEHAGVDANQPYQVVALEPKNDWTSALLHGTFPALKIEHGLNTGTPKPQGGLSYLYQP